MARPECIIGSAVAVRVESGGAAAHAQHGDHAAVVRRHPGSNGAIVIAGRNDRAGREVELATKTDATGTAQYAYDAFGNLLSVKLPSKTITYEHDAANRRTGKLVDAVVIRRWIYSDDLKIVGEVDGAGALVSRFVYGTRINVPDYMIRGLTPTAS